MYFPEDDLLKSLKFTTFAGADPEIFKGGGGGALCWPPCLAGEENFRFQMV